VRAGSSVKGSVVANFVSPVRLFSIKVRLVGMQTTVDPQKASDGAESAASSCFFDHEQQCWASASVEAGGDGAQELSGHMCFSFDIELPSNLPASFKWLGPDSSSATVEYKIVPMCISEADGRTHSAVRAHSHAFKLQEALDLPLLMTSASASAHKRMKLDGGGGACEVELQLPRTLLFAGECVAALVTISNKSRF
jgi:hypothetical protein